MKPNLLRKSYARTAALFLALCALPATMSAQTEYGIEIAGEKVTSENCKDLSVIEGVSGKVSYDDATKTLTLENSAINGGSDAGISSKIDGLTIKLTGINKILSSESGIYTVKSSGMQAPKPLTITGGGTLNVESSNYDGIYAKGTSLVIENCTVNAKGVGFGITGESGIGSENFTIKQATVTAEGTERGSIARFAMMHIDGCDIKKPRQAKFDEAMHAITNLGEILTEPVTIKPVDKYYIDIAGVPVTPETFNDFSKIPGVSGKGYYEPATKVVTFDNITIEKDADICFFNGVTGLTVRVIGNNTLTSANNVAISGLASGSMTFEGDGKLVANGSTDANLEILRTGIWIMADITVRNCTFEITGGVCGILGGEWTFDHCNVRVKGDGSNDKYAGSINYLLDIPKFIGCSIVSPGNTKWQDFTIQTTNYYTLYGEDDKAVTDWVVIEPDETAIARPTVKPVTAKQGIYNLNGVRLSAPLKDLPKGIYIVNGKKVVKQ